MQREREREHEQLSDAPGQLRPLTSSGHLRRAVEERGTVIGSSKATRLASLDRDNVGHRLLVFGHRSAFRKSTEGLLFECPGLSNTGSILYRLEGNHGVLYSCHWNTSATISLRPPKVYTIDRRGHNGLTSPFGLFGLRGSD